MNGRMAAGGPAGAEAQEAGVINVADVETRANNGWTLRLRVTFQAQVHVALNQHFRIDGAVRAVADGATFPHRRVLEDEGPGLFAVALAAVFILARHRQAARWFHDVHAVRVMALNAVHFALDDRVMLGEMKFSLGFLMAPKAGFGIFAGIDDEFFQSTTSRHLNMFAARAMAGFAAGLA